MPLIIPVAVRRSLRRIATLSAVGTLSATGALAIDAGTAAAWGSSPCTTTATAAPFAQFGDQNGYFLMSGGSFETPWGSGWDLGGAQITEGNEPFQVNGAGDHHSLTISAGQTVSSPTFCVDASMPFFRFFATQASAGTDLRVQLALVSGRDRQGTTTDPIADFADGSVPSWGPTAQLPLSSSLVIPSGGSVLAQVRITAPGGSGSWQIDDVYVDPYRVG